MKKVEVPELNFTNLGMGNNFLNEKKNTWKNIMKYIMNY